MLRFPIPHRGSNKTILETQRMMGAVYSREFLDGLKHGENYSEEDYINGLKEVYAKVVEFFYSDDKECE